MNKNNLVIETIKTHPETLEYLALPVRVMYYKAAPITRDELERKLARLIAGVDKRYLELLRRDGVIPPIYFWEQYRIDLRAQIASPLRQYIEQSFTNYSDYVNFIDRAGAVQDIDTAMTRAINDAAQGIAGNTRKQLEKLIQSGLTTNEILDSIALRFSSGHAEQVAITEITRAEAQFSEALHARLAEQGITSIIRWLTSEDEKVCPICAPLDQVKKENGGWMSKSGLIPGPPAHPNCRCRTVVVNVK